MRLPSLLVLLLAATLSIATLVVESGSLVLVSSLGTNSLETTFSSAEPSPAAPATVETGDTLRLSFIVKDAASVEGVQPSQAVILWESKDGKRDYSSTVKVRKGGKGKLELDFARAPTSLLSVSTGPITTSLLLGDSKHAQGLRIPLGTFTFSTSLALPHPYPPIEDLPKGWEADRYSLMPEIHWTFKGPEKTVRTPIALVGLIFVLAPWVVLVTLIGAIKPTFNSPTINIVSFLLCIISFESLIVAYWTSLKLLPTLPYFGLLAVLTAVTGRRALGDVRVRRIAREAKELKSE